MEEKRKVKGSWLKVFCPEARCLTEEEVMDLPKELKGHPKTAGKGLWLEIFCPDEACLGDDGKLFLPIIKAEPEGAGFWLRLFCPRDQCFVEEASDLP